MREINRDLQTTFIMVTHDRALADKTNRIVELRDGLILCDESRSDSMVFE